LIDRLFEGQVDPSQDNEAMNGHEEIMIRNGLSGERYYAMPFPGIREYNVGRLKSLLSEGLDVQYDRTFSHAEYPDDGNVVVGFRDGSYETGTALIGTDGGSSRVHRSAVRCSKKQ
jgi:hypothetical protein